MVVWLTPKDFKIMVVGDLESDRQLYSDYLSQSGFQLAGTSDTVECPERIKHLQPDLVVLDLWLSSPDSWDTVSLLKKDDRTMRIPLVIVTARSFVQAPKAGCDGIVFKPCTSKDLEAEILRVLNASGKYVRKAIPGILA